MNSTIRAWKDPAFRVSLGDEALATLADSPAGVVGDLDSGLSDVVGADHRPLTFHTCFTCMWGSIGCTNTCWVMTAGCTSGSC